jgi:hypothetical protein
MASTRRPVVHRITGLIHVAAFGAQHLALVVAVEIAATMVHAPLGARVVLSVVFIASHWWISRPRG